MWGKKLDEKWTDIGGKEKRKDDSEVSDSGVWMLDGSSINWN